MASEDIDIHSAGKLQENVQDLQVFIHTQEDLNMRIHAALDQQYFVEAISLSTHQLHAILRRGLWVLSQLSIIQKSPEALQDKDLKRILGDSHSGMPEGVPSKELFFAAEKFGFLPDDAGTELGSLMDAAKMLQRDMFDKTDHKQDERYASLGEIAVTLSKRTGEYLDALKIEAQKLHEVLHV